MLFRSRDSNVQYGSFNYPLALVEHSLTPETAGLIEQLSSRRTIDSDAIDAAYAAVSPIHETRHFYDQFGTFAGLSLFSARMQALRSFADASRRLAHEGRTWRLPLSRWLEDSDCPEAVRTFAKTAYADRVGSRVLIGAFKPFSVDRRIDDLIAQVDTDVGRKMDAATVRTVVQGIIPPRHHTTLYPFGVEVLFEGSAHAIMRSCFGGASSALTEALEQRLRVTMTSEEALAEAVSPYMILDLLISRFMKDAGHPRFERDLVLGVADELLSCSAMKIQHLSAGLTSAEITAMGEKLTTVLKSGKIAELKRGRVPASNAAKAGYASMLNVIEKGGDWDAVDDDGSLYADILIWESYAMQHFAGPLLRLRHETKQAAFRTCVGFLGAMNRVRPAAQVASGRISFHSEVPGRVREAWRRVAFADSFVRALAGDGAILCPHAYGALPKLKNVGFSAEGSCATHMLLGCGAFNGGQQTHSPRCFFQRELHLSAFAVPPV